jgi:aspartyl-tRNA(Asn)/glutamyl-tRNA(Gln) amidotransferase subunit A
VIAAEGSRAPAPSPFAFKTARQLRELLRRREVSALELARDALARLDVDGRRLHAVAELTADRAERDALAADRALRRGPAGPLCGIPYGAKDLLDTAGIPTRWGSPFHRDRVPAADATAIGRMRAAGAVLVAKLAMIELAGAAGYRSAAAALDGPCLNPWDHTRWSGGSSSGSCAAVAAGLVPIALGSETAGSLVIPAAFCGVTTLRPSFGRVSRHGAMSVSWTLDKIGPIARTAEDCGAVLRAVEGVDPLDPTTEPAPREPVARRTVRLGVLREGVDGTPAAPAFDGALGVLRGLGMRLSDVTIPPGPYMETYPVIMAAEFLLGHRELIGGPGLAMVVDPSQREALVRHLDLNVTDYAAALRTRARLARDVRAVIGRFDAMVSPTVLTEATALDEDLLEYRATRRGGHAYLGAIAGVPGVSVPMGQGPHGLPLGLTITGGAGSDRSILRIAERYQRATTWHRLHPDLAR